MRVTSIATGASLNTRPDVPPRGGTSTTTQSLNAPSRHSDCCAHTHSASSLCRLFEGQQARRENASGGGAGSSGTGWCNCVLRREAQRKRRRRDALERAGRGRAQRARSWRPAGAGATVLGVSETLSLTIVYEDGGDGWIVASIPEVPGAHSQGHTRQEARENVIDALHGILELRFGEHALSEPASDSEPIELTIAA
jgi:predicted RNase H-like HicB family nuclease